MNNKLVNKSADTMPVFGRGFIDYLEYKNGHLIIIGWMFLPDQPFDGFIVKINNVISGKTFLVERNDVQSAFPSIKSALMSGFDASIEVPETTLRNWVDIDVIGTLNGREDSRISTTYKLDFHSFLKDPPAVLMNRIANTDKPYTYWCRALNNYSEFNKAINRHISPVSIKKLLDWGCGCGRVTSLFLQHSGIPEIYGCDIDREAVEWCSDNLKKGYFSVIDPYPPTKFSDNMFDVIIGYSVFTHLDRNMQENWLREMKRIMVPGGLFLASCHGDFATSFAPKHVQKEVSSKGISDGTLDNKLDGIAPSKYYRCVYQSRAYNEKEWGKQFKIIDYVERGMANLQDLVVMQKIKLV